MSAVFDWPIRVYYEDTDVGGLVYHSRYLCFLERARTEWLRALGFEQDNLARDAGVLFAVRRVELDYLYPARFNDQLSIRSTIPDVRRVSLTFAQTVHRTDDDKLLLSAQVRIACLDTAHHRPSAMPSPMLAVIKALATSV